MLVFTGKNARKVMKNRAKLLTIWAATDLLKMQAALSETGLENCG